ncbi:MAG: translation initiation factor IF-2 [Phycisphaeraceae bacterium]|nr:translation initiation factor IF-2 [Phycisphaeraceae bacterium]
MAKRVFELAKELSVKSKAIVDKCQAEGIPNISNHMSSVSAGLEATIVDWFSADNSGGGTAVETAEKVDLDRVRVKRRAKPKTAPMQADEGDGDDDSAVTATTVEAAPEVPTPTVPTPAPAAPRTPAVESKPEPKPAPAEKKPESPEAPKPSVSRPAAAAKVETDTKRRPSEKIESAPLNVPTRPKVVKPVGPKLEVQKPAKVSGPKVIRVEAPEALPAPRARRGGGGGGPATMEPGGPMPVPGGRGVGFPSRGGEGEDEKGGRRNKRRGGGGGGTGSRDRGRDSRSGGGSGGGGGEWSEKDLLEREQRLSRSEGYLRQRRRDQKIKTQQTSSRATTLAETGGTAKVTKPFTIKDLSAATGVKSADIIKKLFMKGIMANMNASLEDEMAQEIMLEYNIELEIAEAHSAAEAVVQEFEVNREQVDVQSRAPIVTILGHVDHGKTSLLDRIRNTNVAAGEAGGITQATSSFRVPVKVGDEEKWICFLDTPGHEAFSEMRSRGAHMTDIVVLVVAATDGVMPQTVESIAHAKAAGVPIIVALNKIDVPSVTNEQIQKIYGQLAEHGLNPTEWGGETEVIKTSATKGTGIQELLETLDLQAQLLELTADFEGAARGTVVESRIVEGRGPVANILVQEGHLEVGQFIVAGRGFGRVRDITDPFGERLKEAGPSMPVQISGLNEVPDAGDRFYIVDSLKKAQEAAEHRKDQDRQRELAQPKVTLDSMFAQMDAAEKKELLIVLKADVQGSVDAIKKSVEDIATDEVRVRVLYSAVGGVSESDVTLAAASGAVILGFNVIPTGKARQLAEQKGVEIRSYQIIYDIVDDMKKAAEGLLEPEMRQEILGHAEVRQVFKITRVGAIAGCYVTDGTIERNAMIRVTRDGIVIENNRVLEQLKRFKDDVKEVRNGQECGMKIVGYDDIKDGDILECYRNVEVRRSL